MLFVVIIIHTLLAVGLIAAVLLHSGKGTGLSSSMGGMTGGSFGGTGVIEKNLDRFTVILSLLFTVTTLILVALV